MPAATEAEVENVRALVLSIPPGKVCTYGDLASAAGLSSPRVAGWIMRTDGADLPWHRVIGAGGKPAPHLAARQLALLFAEGTPIRNGKVDMTSAHYLPAPTRTPDSR